MALTKVPSNLDATVATTQSASDNSTNIATTAYVTTAIDNLVDSSPAALNTLNELAAALNDDASFSTTVTNSIATKVPLAGGTMTGDLIVTKSSAKLEATESGGASVRMIAGGSTGYIGNYSNHSLQILTDSTPAITIDNTQNATFAGTVGIGSGSGTTASSGYDEFVIQGGNADIGMAFLSPAANNRTQIIAFGDSNNNKSGSIAYDHSADSLTLDSAGEIILDADLQGSGNGILLKDAGTLYGSIFRSSSHLHIKAEAQDKKLLFLTNNGGSELTAMTIDSSGKVGIGTDDPSQKLEILDTSTAKTRFAYSDAIYGEIGRKSDGNYEFSAYENGANLIFGTSTTNSATTEKMRITSGGNVIINKSNFSSLPTGSKLNIFGDGVTLRLDGSSATTKSILFRQTNATNPGEVYADGSLRFRTEDANTRISFHTNSSGSNNERMRIDEYGGIWQEHFNHGRYTWVQRVIFSGGQTKNLTFHLGGGNVHGQVRVTMNGDYSNVNANGSFEKVWGWGYNSSNTSGYGGQGSGTTIVDVGSTSNVMTFGGMSKTNATTVIIPINNTNASYQVICNVTVEITGELQGLQYISI